MTGKPSCYMCSSAAKSTEHAPPKCFFPETKDLPRGSADLRLNLITVPSCDVHNSAKSKDDEYAMLVAVAHFETNAVARNHFGTKVVRALTRSPAFTASVFHKSRGVRLGTRETAVVEVDLDRFYRVMDHTCRALVFDASNAQLLTQLYVWSTSLRYPNLKQDPDEAGFAFTVRRLLKGHPKLGHNPDVFYYQLHYDASRPFAALRLVFYGGFQVYAVTTGTRS